MFNGALGKSRGTFFTGRLAVIAKTPILIDLKYFQTCVAFLNYFYSIIQ
jgi:hypothetical protein